MKNSTRNPEQTSRTTYYGRTASSAGGNFSQYLVIHKRWHFRSLVSVHKLLVLILLVAIGLTVWVNLNRLIKTREQYIEKRILTLYDELEAMGHKNLAVPKILQRSKCVFELIKEYQAASRYPWMPLPDDPQSSP